MSRKWYSLGLLVFAAAACGGADDNEMDDLDIEAEEQTLPPPAPMDTTMMMGDTMMGDTMMGDTMRRP